MTATAMRPPGCPPPSGPLTCPPLFGTQRSPERPTLGGRVAEIAAKLGKPPMPHQRHIYDVAFEIDPETGLFAYNEVVVIGPRQVTGKTELMLPAMTYRCIGFDDALVRWVREQLGRQVPSPGPQTVAYTAQTSDEARKKWRKVHLARLAKSPYRRDFHARLQRNEQVMMWRNGSSWSPASTTGKTSGTGDSLDMPVIDEAWAQASFRTELGLLPAMMTRLWRQMWVLSMIPGLSRAAPGSWPYLAHKRQVGQAQVEAGVRHGTAFFDFSAPRGLDPGDPATWWTAMPGLGSMEAVLAGLRTVTEDTVRADFAKMDLVDFCAEYLGWEPLASTPRWTLIQQETWEGLRDPLSAIEGRPALSVEIDDDRGSAVIAAAGKRADGNWHLEVVEPGFKIAPGAAGIDWVLPRALEIIEDQKPWTVVIDPSRPASSLIVPLKNRGIDVLTPNQRDVAGACGRFFDATGEGAVSGDDDEPAVRVFHLGQPELNRAVAGARKLDVGAGAFVFVKKGSASGIKPLYGVVLAMHGFDVKSSAEIPRSKVW